MKTLNNVIRALFAAHKNEKKSSLPSPPPAEEKPELSTINQQKLQENETETDEVAGDSSLAHPDAQEARGNDQNQGDRLQAMIDEAYQRGLIDGRNQKIEMLYFPKNDDGVPRFHGYSPQPQTHNDIFTMARQA